MLSGEHVADGKLCPMAVTDSSQRSEGQGGLASGCVTVLNWEGTLIEMEGGVPREARSCCFFVRKSSVYLTELVIHSFNKPSLSCCSDEAPGS